MPDSRLSTQQLQIVDALSSGVTLTDAAAQAGVHRNTIAYWRRNSPQFQAALAQAQDDCALIFREKAETLVDLAFEALRLVLSDPKASPSARLKAATFVIELATNPRSTKINKRLGGAGGSACQPSASPKPEPDPPSQNTAEMHKNAQKPEPYCRPEPKIGRNAACPCGSGKKYKRCCLNKPLNAAA